jgi:hypothetical protein
VQTVRKSAANGIMGVVGHPYVPYILVLLGLLRSL